MKKSTKELINQHNAVCIIAMTFGYKAHERGINLEKARQEISELLKIENVI